MTPPVAATPAVVASMRRMADDRPGTTFPVASVTLERVARSRRLHLVARASVVLGMAALVLDIVAKAGRTPLGQVLALVAIVTLLAAPLLHFVAWLASFFDGVAKQGEVAADAEGVRLVRPREHLVARREDIQSGLVVPRGGAAEVELALRSGDRAHVVVDSHERADALLAALGQAPRQRRVTLRWARTFHRLAYGFGVYLVLSWMAVAIGGAVGRALHEPAAVGLATIFALPLAALLIPPISRWLAAGEVTVGLDAIEVAGRGRRRLVPLDGFESADFYQHQLRTKQGGTITVRDGVELSGPAGVERIPMNPDDPAEAVAILQRIREVLRLRREGGVVDVAALLARGDRAVGEWRREVARLLGEASYRARAVDEDGVAAVLADPRGDADARLGAAIALMAKPSEQARTRVRIAAETTADPDVRRALEAIAEGEAEDAELEVAVAKGA